MKELTSAKKRKSEDEVDNMVGFRGNQKSRERENLMECERNQHGDFTDGGETGENDENLRISNELGDDGTHRRVLRNMVGTRDENFGDIIDDSDEQNTVVNDRGYELQLYPFSMLDCLGVIASIIVFFFDVVTDILLAIEYKDHGRTVECALTSSVVIASFLVAGTLSTIWYLQDESGNKGTVKNILFLIVAFPFATIIRNFSYFRHGCLSRVATEDRKITHYKEMIKNDSDASLLRMFDAFVESAPQLSIQIYIAMHDTPQEAIHLELLRSVTIASSLAGLAWSVTGYNRALRIFNATSGLRANTICGAVGYFLWRVFEIGPRITAIVMLISIDSHGFYIIFGSIFHWMVMMTVAFFKNVKVYRNKLHNILFIVFISFVQIISYMNLSRGKSRLLAIAYYSLFHVENAVMVALFVFLGDVDTSGWVFIVVVSVASSGIVFSTLFMVMYYVLCHPKVSRDTLCIKMDMERKDEEDSGRPGRMILETG